MNRATYLALAALAVGIAGLPVPQLHAQTPPPPPAAPTTTAPTAMDSVREQLISLQKMLDERLISPQEFEAARAKLLASIGAAPPPPAPASPPAAPTPAPAPPAPAAPAPPPPPPSPLPTFAGRWSVVRTRVDNLPGQVLEVPEPAATWVVTVQNGTLAISREEEVVRFGRRPLIEFKPLDVSGAAVSGNALTFVIKQATQEHDRLTTSTYTYQLQLGAANAIAGTYSRDAQTTEPHGVVDTHEAGKVALVRLPG